MRYTELANRLEAAGCRTFWFGPAAAEQIVALEKLLGVTLPRQFADFLLQLGGGGVEGAEITGINGTADQDSFGTVVGDTMRLRKTFDLSPDLVVLRIADDEYAWCIDSGRGDPGSVVGVALGIDTNPKRLASGFAEYFGDYVDRQIRIHKNS